MEISDLDATIALGEQQESPRQYHAYFLFLFLLRMHYFCFFLFLFSVSVEASLVTEVVVLFLFLLRQMESMDTNISVKSSLNA